MIPILFEKTATTFTTNGLGRLAETTRCIVSEERNGIYELELDYPVTGKMFDQITKGRIIAVAHDENGDVQAFDIYASTEPINGVVTFFANHISYRLREIVTAPFSASSCSAALSGLVSHAYTTNPFTMTTDIVSSSDFVISEPTSVRSALGGMDGSILDIYGGEYEFDNFDVTLYANRGSVKDYEIRYGKNIIEYEDSINYADTYNGVVPYWYGVDEEDNDVSVVGSVTMSGQSMYNGRNVIVPMNLSEEFENQPTSNELETRALAIMSSNQPWLPDRNITLTAIPQWESDEYNTYLNIGLCDTVKIVFPLYNMSGTMKIVKTEYNVLLEKYDAIELGKLQTSLAQAINANLEPQIDEVQATSRRALKIAGNSVQHFWFTSTGNDTGAHIAEVDRDTFEATPSGGNLLARSNGIAIRNGLKELAQFSANGIAFNNNNNLNLFTMSGTQITGAHSVIIDTTLETRNAALQLYDAVYDDNSSDRTALRIFAGGTSWNSISKNRKFLSVELLAPQSTLKVGYDDIPSNTNYGGYYNLEVTDNDSKTAKVWITKPSDPNRTSLDYTITNASIRINVADYTHDERWITIGSGNYLTDNGIGMGTGLSGAQGIYDFTFNKWVICTGASDQEVFIPIGGASTTSSSANAVISSGGRLQRRTSSSKRYKEDIKKISDETLLPEKLYKLQPRQFVYKDGYITDENDKRKGVPVTGFIAEEVEKIYPIAADYNENGQIENWDSRYIIPPMLALIQKQKAEIDKLTERVIVLEEAN